MSLTESPHLEQQELYPESSRGASDSTGLVGGLLGCGGGHAGAGGAAFGEHGGFGPRGRRLHLRGHFDGFDRPEGAGDVPGRAGTALERGL